MGTIAKLIKSKTPFSVIRYYEWMSGTSQSRNVVYELLTCENGYLDDRVLTEKEVEKFKSFIPNLEIKALTNDGTAYEFLNFKSYADTKGALRFLQGRRKIA